MLSKHIRLATKEEIEGIREQSNYPAQARVLAMDSNVGDPDLAVVKNIIEVDPIVWGARTNDMQRAKFLFALEERLLGAGVDHYFFNIDAADEHYLKVVRHWGAEQCSPHPVVRFQKVLTEVKDLGH